MESIHCDTSDEFDWLALTVRNPRTLPCQFVTPITTCGPPSRTCRPRYCSTKPCRCKSGLSRAPCSRVRFSFKLDGHRLPAPRGEVDFVNGTPLLVPPHDFPAHIVPGLWAPDLISAMRRAVLDPTCCGRGRFLGSPCSPGMPRGRSQSRTNPAGLTASGFRPDSPIAPRQQL